MFDVFIECFCQVIVIFFILFEVVCCFDVVCMGYWFVDELNKFGVQVEFCFLGKQQGIDFDFFFVVFVCYGSDKNKCIILVYGYYDVQLVEKEDGWEMEFFELIVKEDGCMLGCGLMDDKGFVFGWLNVIEVYKVVGIEFFVNFFMCFEGMEEYGFDGLDDLINVEVKKYFVDVDVVCISDNYWFGIECFCFIYGFCGCNYYSVEVFGFGVDFYSGVFGGIVQEFMIDLVCILGLFVDMDGKIQIFGIVE